MAVATRRGEFNAPALSRFCFLGTKPLIPACMPQEVRPYAWALLFAKQQRLTTMNPCCGDTAAGPGPTPNRNSTDLSPWFWPYSLLLLSPEPLTSACSYAATLVALDLRSGAPCLGPARPPWI